jgi:O-antigen/teichoic acid export membrane protein
MRRLSTFTRGFASTFVLDVAARAMSAATTVLLLHALDVSGFAFIVLLLAVGQFLGGAATGGLRLRYVRTEAERVSRGEGERTSFWVAWRSGNLLVLAAGVLGFLGATALGIGESLEERATFVGLGVAYTLAHATVELSVFHHQAQLAFTRGGLISVLRSTIILVCSLAATFNVLETGEQVGLAFAIGVGALAVVVAGPIAWQTRRSIAGREGRFGFGRESASLTIYSIASAGWAYATVFLVAALLDETAVASYGAASRYISVVIGPVPALVSVIRVRTAQSDMIDSEEAQIDMMRNWAKRVAPLALVVLGAAGIAAPFAIPFVDGGKYPLSVPIFEVMLVLAFAQLVTLPNSSLLITQKRYTLLAKVNVAAVVAYALVAIVVAPLLGVVGVVAAGTLVAVVQVSTVTYLAAHPPQADPTPSPTPAELVH